MLANTSWAIWAGTGPYPVTSAAPPRSGSSSASTGSTIPTSTLTSVAVAWPVTRSTKVSAMISIPGSGITRRHHRIGVAAQRGQTCHPLLDREQARQHAHRVRRRPQPHTPIRPGRAPAGHIARAVGLVRQPLRQGGCPASGQGVDPLRAQLLVHQPAELADEVPGLADHRRGGVLADPSGRQQRAYTGQIESQRAGNAQTPRPVKRRDATGHPELIPDPTTDRARIERVIGDLRLHLGAGERDHFRLLRGRYRAPELFQHGDPVDPVRVRTRGVNGNQRAEPREHGRQLVNHRIPTTARTHVWNLATRPDKIGLV